MQVQPGWLVLFRDMGIEPGNVLRRARLPEDLFAREGAKLSVAEYFRLWEAGAEELNDPELPIRLVEVITAEAFNPMVFAALCSPDLTVAMQRIATYKRLIAPMTVSVEMRDDGLFVAKRWDDDGESELPASLAATELVILVEIARMGLRERIVPVSVASPLPMAPAEAFVAYFGVTPVAGAERSITFRAEDGRKPFMTANEAVWQTFEPELQRRLTTLEATAPLSERVRSALLESLPSGEASMQAISRRLGLSTRTLQRRLRSESTSFKDIVRTTREKLARHYLTNTRVDYNQIAFLIGFDDPSSFFRAFREWTGATPESMRLSGSRPS